MKMSMAAAEAPGRGKTFDTLVFFLGLFGAFF